MEMFWVFLNTNQLLFLAPLVGVPLPLNAVAFYKILAFANGDFYLFTLLYENSLARLVSPSPSSALSPYFDFLGSLLFT